MKIINLDTEVDITKRLGLMVKRSELAEQRYKGLASSQTLSNPNTLKAVIFYNEMAKAAFESVPRLLVDSCKFIPDSYSEAQALIESVGGMKNVRTRIRSST